MTIPFVELLDSIFLSIVSKYTGNMSSFGNLLFSMKTYFHAQDAIFIRISLNKILLFPLFLIYLKDS